jgi:hypothetical protein
VDVPGAVDVDPGPRLPQVVEHHLPVHHEIPNHGELGEGLQHDGLLEVHGVHEGGTGLLWLAVDEHAASSAYLLHAVAFPEDGFHAPAVGGERVLPHHHESGDHVVPRLVRDAELLPVALRAWAVLAPDLEMDGVGHGGSYR